MELNQEQSSEEGIKQPRETKKKPDHKKYQKVSNSYLEEIRFSKSEQILEALQDEEQNEQSNLSKDQTQQKQSFLDPASLIIESEPFMKDKKQKVKKLNQKVASSKDYDAEISIIQNNVKAMQIGNQDQVAYEVNNRRQSILQIGCALFCLIAMLTVSYYFTSKLQQKKYPKILITLQFIF